jgi:hypothetical protein
MEILLVRKIPLFRSVWTCPLLLFQCIRADAYTVITASTAAPAGIEAAFIASTTNQFLSTIVPNPFFANTQSITLFGSNPNFNPPPTNADLLNALVTVDSYTYTSGWANGESYQQFQDVNLTGNFIVNCDSPTAWNIAIDTTTCYAVLGAIENAIYLESLSTPTVVPGNFQ